MSGGVDLDLDSSERNIVLGNNLFSAIDSVQIRVGNSTKTIRPGSSVSAAEYIAIKQVLAGSGQRIEIDQKGRAAGGDIDLTVITSANDPMKATSLVVSKDVTVYGDFGRSSEFKLIGDLENFGTIFTTPGNRFNQRGTIKADNILNHKNAIITSSTDLALFANREFVNFGTIISDSSLTIESGTNFKNNGSVEARKDLVIFSADQTNAGTISTNEGNVFLDAQTISPLSVSNRNGVIKAERGAINVRSTTYSGTHNTSLSGGDLLSKEVNIHTGLGTANLSVEELTGTVNQVGSAVHILAATELLTLGSICLDDPAITIQQDQY